MPMGAAVIIRYNRASFNVYTEGDKASPAPVLAPPLKSFGPQSESPFLSENEQKSC